ncbi:ubiB [Symbiodinium microadriaticum]|nr:ubiB [Symbiodinium microadriaticum]CAE7950014.1 ubiB [Symbiodinium sp. KB8]
MATYCTYESTFIAVKDAAPPRRVSLSAPPSGDRPQVGETRAARNYVKNLEHRAEQLHAERPPTPDGAQEIQTEEPVPVLATKQEEQPTPVKADAATLPSKGSYGHPELCRKPCLFLRYGNCPNGVHCEYCHVPHSSRAVKLDKRQRDSLKELSESALLGLLLPHLNARVSTLNLPQGAADTVGLMEQHLASLPHEAEGHSMAAWKLNQLNRLLKQMSFMRLIRLAPCSDEGAIKEALVRLQAGKASTQGED